MHRPGSRSSSRRRTRRCVRLVALVGALAALPLPAAAATADPVVATRSAPGSWPSSASRAAVAAAAPAASGSILVVSGGDVWMVSPDGLRKRRVTTDGATGTPYRYPSRADDGTIVVVQGTDLVVRDGTGRPVRRLHPTAVLPLGIWTTRVSPDATSVAYETAMFCQDAAGHTILCFQTHVVRTDGGDSTTLDPALFGPGAPVWIGNSTLAVTAFHQSVHTYTLGATGTTGWVPYQGSRMDEPTVSRTGTRLAAAAGGILETNRPASQVVVFTAAGPGATPTARCATGTGQFATPAFSPDGTRLAYVTTDGVHVATFSGSLETGDCSGTDLFVMGANQPFWSAAPYDRPTVRVDDVSVAEGAAGTTTKATFVVRLSGAQPVPVTVSYATANGTAASPSDFTARTGTVTIAPGATRASIAVTVKGDATKEATETFAVTLKAVGGVSGAKIADGSATGTITDDD